MEDKRNILRIEQPFGYREIKDNKVQIIFNNKLIKTIQGKEFNKFHRILELNNPYELQLFMAKITGQFKHGNERQSKKHFK